MPNVDKHNPGTFCWIDLATTDIDSAKSFYGDLFGWSLEDGPAGEGQTYTMATIDKRSICGMSAQPEEMKGAPPVWTSYISVRSADDTAKKATSLGATILAEPFDVMEFGRMAVIADTTGGTFAIWEPRAHHGAQVVQEPNTLCWNELLTNDTSKASEFYGSLFGWTADMKGDYTEFKNGDQVVGGMMKITEQMGDLPTHWGVYFSVANVDRVAERVKALGGREYKAPADIENVGRFACFADPQGGGFAVIKLAHHGE
jgi:hypothetical protein